MTNCVFSHNLATKWSALLQGDVSSSGNFGGYIYGSKTFFIISHSIISENYASKGILITHKYILA